MTAADAAQWVTTAAMGAGLIVALIKLNGEKRKTSAEALALIQQANRTRVETSFVGIKEISEAAAVLVVPLKTENIDLRKEVNELRERVDLLEEERDQMRRERRNIDLQLHEERQTRAMMQRAFEERTKALIEEYERDMRALREQMGSQQ